MLKKECTLAVTGRDYGIISAWEGLVGEGKGSSLHTNPNGGCVGVALGVDVCGVDVCVVDVCREHVRKGLVRKGEGR